MFSQISISEFEIFLLFLIIEGKNGLDKRRFLGLFRKSK